MEFFGITMYGPQNFFSDILKEGYAEPTKEEEVDPLMEKVIARSTCPKSIERPKIDTHKVIDCYLGRTDGFAYGSFQRFIKMKMKSVRKPVGPHDMYRFPPVRSQEYGWFMCDPVLQKSTWHLPYPDKNYKVVFSPNTRVLDLAKKNNKYATLF